jgi:hypothetical protein
VGEGAGFGELFLQARQQVISFDRLTGEAQFGPKGGGPTAIPERRRIGHEPF